MPYIKIKAFPKDEETKKIVADEIFEVMKKHWGCPPKAISLSIEAVDPADWEEKVVKAEIEPAKDKMFILNGEKKF
ncbi:MAG: tautomerase family protein [Abditibacteriota bacterium]|nr:tautomerase family protein [Abditibacteriota bacterium]MBP5093780.1 tautomerase family protein [Abditibacteriota bacterium]